ncbi:hypothetical protein BH11ARM2_BH11ARM2_34240 [soil metagenome]
MEMAFLAGKRESLPAETLLSLRDGGSGVDRNPPKRRGASRDGGFVAHLYALPLVLAHQREPSTFGVLSYDPALPIYLVPILLISTLSGFDGCYGSVRDNFKEDFSLVTFLATRPMADASLIEAKLRMAAWAVLRSWAILAIGPVFLLLSPLTVAGAPTTVGAYLVAHASLRGVTLALLTLGTLGLFTWRGLASAMWLRLSHRASLRNGVGLVLPSLVLFATPFVGLRVHDDPSLLPALTRWTLPVLSALAFLKLLAALAAVRRVRELGLLPDRTLVRWLAVSGILGGSLFLAFSTLLPSLPLTPFGFGLAVFLLLPLFRVQLAILVLHDNRRRSK